MAIAHQAGLAPGKALAGLENEPEETDLMRRPPRRHDEPLLGRRDLLAALLSGLRTAALVAALLCAGARPLCGRHSPPHPSS
jgi:hypothetical protein